MMGGSDDIDAMIEAKFSKLRVYKSANCPKSQDFDQFTKTWTYEDEGGNMVCVDVADGEQLSKMHRYIVDEYKRVYMIVQQNQEKIEECEKAKAETSAGEAERKYQELLARVSSIEADLAACSNKSKLAMDALSGGRRTREQIIAMFTDNTFTELLPSLSTGRRQPCRGMQRTYHIGSAYGSRSGFCVFEESARLFQLSAARAAPHFRELYQKLYAEGGLIDRVQACKEKEESVRGGAVEYILPTFAVIVVVGVGMLVAEGMYNYNSSSSSSSSARR